MATMSMYSGGCWVMRMLPSSPVPMTAVFTGSPWSWFVQTAVEYDEFKAFDARVSGNTGLGFEFFKNDFSTLTGRFGASTSKEIGGIDDEVKPEILYGFEYERKISERQKASASVDYFPDVTDAHDYRLNAKASWEVVVDPDWGLSLKLSANNRFDSTPDPGNSKNDIDYSALMLWSF